MDNILKLVAGNPGALQCLMGMINEAKNSVYGLTIIPKLEKLGIKGTDIYVLWSDISDKDYQIMSRLCAIVPDELLVEAASKQDYSGRELLKSYYP